MEKESITKLASTSMKRTLLIFSFGGLILHYVVYTIFFICKIVWFEFLHYNPYRSQAQALEDIIRAPVDGLLFLLFSMFPVIVGTIIAMVSHRIWGRVPFYSLIVTVPLCSYVYLHNILLPNLEPNEIVDIFGITLRELLVWGGCWWWSNRTPNN
ncbi:hypothetical protein [Sporomusa sp.]|uniref:hypothetical protein n=1 Tax=Sporomusa sp. TaxID=2078658 RepID=UPI002CAF3DED|nr:hypothetical protein [Sporomusa sp.]HWR42707.1 hypothetical protein [Sporomusa sp.]